MKFRNLETISLNDELAIVANYCYLIEKRFGGSFELNIHLPQTEGNVLPLSLQMLVENAVKHNVISPSKPLRVDISMKTDGWLCVENNLQPKRKSEDSTHFGLNSLAVRYELIARKKIKVEKGDRTFCVQIPLIYS